MRPHPVVILRHPKERRSKCTLQPFRWKEGFFFHNAAPGFRYEATGHLLLAVDAPPLTPEDGIWSAAERAAAEAAWKGGNDPSQCARYATFARRPLLLLDATWRRLPSMAECVVGNPLRRSLPSDLATAYPRRNQEGLDPDGGLASVEALYAALAILGHSEPALLDHYRWNEEFLARMAQSTP